MNEPEKKVASIQELKRMQEELVAEIAATEDELKAYTTENSTDTLHGPSFKITWKPATSTRLDGKAVKAANPNLWALCCKQTTARRFVLC